jgi:hypothetical protein
MRGGLGLLCPVPSACGNGGNNGGNNGGCGDTAGDPIPACVTVDAGVSDVGCPTRAEAQNEIPLPEGSFAFTVESGPVAEGAGSCCYVIVPMVHPACF